MPVPLPADSGVLGLLPLRRDLSAGNSPLFAGFMTEVRMGAGLHKASPAVPPTAAAVAVVGDSEGLAAAATVAAAAEMGVTTGLCTHGAGP